MLSVIKNLENALVHVIMYLASQTNYGKFLSVHKN